MKSKQIEFSGAVYKVQSTLQTAPFLICVRINYMVDVFYD